MSVRSNMPPAWDLTVTAADILEYDAVWTQEDRAFLSDFVSRWQRTASIGKKWLVMSWSKWSDFVRYSAFSAQKQKIHDAAQVAMQALAALPSVRTEKQSAKVQVWAKLNRVFEGADKASQLAACAKAVAVTYRPNEVVFLQGQHGERFYVVVEGEISLYAEDDKNREQEALREFHRDADGFQDQNFLKETAPVLEGAPCNEEEDAHVIPAAAQKYLSEEMKGRSRGNTHSLLGRHFHTVVFGNGFGELALFDETSTRSCSAVASKPTVLFELERSAYQETIRAYHMRNFGTTAKVVFLQNNRLFSEWRGSMITRLAFSLQERSIPRGAKILRQGHEAKELLFIKQGEVKMVMRKKPDELYELHPSKQPPRNLGSDGRPQNLDVEVALLSANDCVVEPSLLDERLKDHYQVNYGFSLVANSTVQLYWLKRSDFHVLIKGGKGNETLAALREVIQARMELQQQRITKFAQRYVEGDGAGVGRAGRRRNTILQIPSAGNSSDKLPKIQKQHKTVAVNVAIPDARIGQNKFQGLLPEQTISRHARGAEGAEGVWEEGAARYDSGDGSRDGGGGSMGDMAGHRVRRRSVAGLGQAVIDNSGYRPSSLATAATSEPVLSPQQHGRKNSLVGLSAPSFVETKQQAKKPFNPAAVYAVGVAVYGPAWWHLFLESAVCTTVSSLAALLFHMLPMPPAHR
jgi:CRP-like cAMP-binding protein